MLNGRVWNRSCNWAEPRSLLPQAALHESQLAESLSIDVLNKALIPMADSAEVANLRQNADNLAQCLHALLLRIEQLEQQKEPSPPQEDNDHNVQVICSDSVSVDPDTGLKKRTIVTERVLTTKTYQASGLSPSALRLWPSTRRRGLRTAQMVTSCRRPTSPVPSKWTPPVSARSVSVSVIPFPQLDVERIAGQLVVTKVAPDASHGVHPGDTILEVDGRSVSSREELQHLKGEVTVTLVPATLHQAPAVWLLCWERCSCSIE